MASTPLWIAGRFLKSSRGQTALIVVGIAVAISVQVFVGALITSLQAGLIEDTIGHSPHVTVEADALGGEIGQWESKAEAIRGVAGVEVVSATASGSAFIDSGGPALPAVVRGFALADADSIYGFTGAIVAGEVPSARGQVAVGTDLAGQLGVGVGDEVTLAPPTGDAVPFHITGVVELGAAAVDGAWVVMGLADAQALLGLGENVTGLEATVSDVFAADAVAADVEATLADPALSVVNWKEQNAQLLSGLQAQSVSSNMIQGFILVSVIVTIASVLSITVLQKSRQIGILKAMGLSDGEASRVFLFEGLILGGAGAVGGILLGAGLLLSFTTFAKGADGEPVVAIAVEASFLATSFAIAMVSSAVAAALPARRSRRLSPVDVIRGV